MPDGHKPIPPLPQDDVPGIAGLDAATIRALWDDGIKSAPLDGETVIQELRALIGTRR